MYDLTRATPATADVLGVLLGAGEPVWGLLIAKQAVRPTGSVYPILARLESAGWVVSEWEEDDERRGARRRLYRLTAEGADAATAMVSKLRAAVTSRPIGASPIWVTS